MHSSRRRPADRRPAVETAADRVLPESLHLLFIGPEEPGWTALTLELEQLGADHCRFRWLHTASEAARLVHQEHFDCIVVDDATPQSALPDESEPAIEILDLPAVLRTAGCLDPILMLSDRVDDGWLTAIANAGIELLTTTRGWRSKALTSWIRRTIERHRSAREHQELRAQQGDAVHLHASNSDRQLQRRQNLAERLHRSAATRSDWEISSELLVEYAAVLQASLMAGEADPSPQLQRLAMRLASQRLTVECVWDLHVAALGQLTAGLGHRSAQQIWQQAELAVVELLVCLQETWLRGLAFRSVQDSGVELID